MSQGAGPMESQENQIASVALATFSSRMAGLLRDGVLFALLGLGAWNNAFLFAFTIPNLFRRLLGEGALASAMIPLFSEIWNQHEKSDAFEFLNRLVTRLILIILALLLISNVLIFIGLPFVNMRWHRALMLTSILSPYLLMACISAMLCGALNVLDSFGLPALTATWLNLTLLLAGGTALIFFHDGGLGAVLLLCVGILGGGILQVFFPWWMLRRRGWKFHWDMGHNAWIQRLWSLFAPALIGAAVVQINMTISRLLAFWLTPSGISTLYLSSRLVELPLGVFVIAISSVLFPAFAKCAAAENRTEFTRHYDQAQRAMLMITIPATLGLAIMGRPILGLLFQWGNFSDGDLQQTYPVLLASVIGIPFYALTGISIRAFHARQDMKTPLCIASWTIAINFLLTLLLVKPWGASGIALASCIAAAIQYFLLQHRLHPHLSPRPFFLKKYFSSLLIANGLLLLTLGGWSHLFQWLQFAPKWNQLLQISLSIGTGFFIYLGTLHRLKFPEVSLFLAFLRPLWRFRRH